MFLWSPRRRLTRAHRHPQARRAGLRVPDHAGQLAPLAPLVPEGHGGDGPPLAAGRAGHRGVPGRGTFRDRAGRGNVCRRFGQGAGRTSSTSRAPQVAGLGRSFTSGSVAPRIPASPDGGARPRPPYYPAGDA